MTRFLPSEHGLRFTNTWPADAKVTVGRVPVGSAARGLCGGMVFTALDVFTAGLPPLEDARPGPGSPLFDYIVRRLFDSWDIPRGVLRYYRAMASRTAAVGEKWPALRADLDAGRPCPLGLVTVRSLNPVRLGENHQVLAYGYHAAGDGVTVRVYDPNTDLSAADDVGIRLDRAGRVIGHNVGVVAPIRAFFRARYVAKDPSGLSPVGRQRR